MSDEPRTLVLPEVENRLALVIGVNRAPSAQTLQLRTTLQANNDAEAMAQMLEEACGFAEVKLLLGEEATSERAKKEVLSLARKRTEHDFLLLYFAGHGHPIVISAEEQDIYLVTHDFNEQEVEEDEALHCSMGWLRDKLYMPTAAYSRLLLRGQYGPQRARSLFREAQGAHQVLPWCTGLRKWQPSRRYVLALPNSQDRAGVL